MSENMNCPCCGAIPGQAHDDDCALVAFLTRSMPIANVTDSQGLAVPLPAGKVVDHQYRCGKCGDTDGGWCSIKGCPNPRPDVGVKPSGGGKLTGDHYYRVKVANPIAPDVQPYTAECADIIEALGMTFNEGEAFKAIWRLAAGRQGKTKNAPQYDADKAAHYGERIAACVRNNSNPTT